MCQLLLLAPQALGPRENHVLVRRRMPIQVPLEHGGRNVGDIVLHELRQCVRAGAEASVGSDGCEDDRYDGHHLADLSFGVIHQPPQDIPVDKHRDREKHDQDPDHPQHSVQRAEHTAEGHGVRQTIPQPEKGPPLGRHHPIMHRGRRQRHVQEGEVEHFHQGQHHQDDAGYEDARNGRLLEVVPIRLHDHVGSIRPAQPLVRQHIALIVLE
mmetsp:Transcript_49663/g.130984  ORF Transcript_49663/g.130984 Transcript_49663/m.130984 type:complete len:212 (+) Transcript_49663:261-896(+)